MTNKQQLDELGFTVLDDIFSNEEIENILFTINSADSTNPTFRKSKDLFAIRQFLIEIPALRSILFNDKLRSTIKNLLGENFFLVKSIYFDKPEKSNWFVSYHQDLTISVDIKGDIPNYGPWTVNKINLLYSLP